MVQQYNQNNINSPRGAQLFDADAALDLDNDMIVVTTADGPVTLTLPTAVQIPGQEVVIKANDAGSTGNVVTLVSLAGQNIDGDASIELTEDQGSVCLKSDGSNWRVLCGDSGGGGAPVRAALPVYDASVSGPQFAYKVLAGDANESITIQGRNLSGITTVDVSTDVNVESNGSPPPVVGTLVVTDVSIVVPLDATNSVTSEDFWGIILRDADGNVYGAPSPIKIAAPF